MSSDNWGGKRSGAGRKLSDTTKKSVVIRIPEVMQDQVRALVNGTNTSVGDNRLEQIEAILSDWRRTRPTHSPSYKNVDRLLSELETVFLK